MLEPVVGLEGQQAVDLWPTKLASDARRRERGAVAVMSPEPAQLVVLLRLRSTFPDSDSVASLLDSVGGLIRQGAHRLQQIALRPSCLLSVLVGARTTRTVCSSVS